MPKDMYDEANYRQLMVWHYPKVQNNDKCARQIYNTNYWLAFD
jgi:hypothetical protein